MAAYWELNNFSASKIKALGPSFFTKFLYFASADMDAPAIILDKVVAANVNVLVGTEKPLRDLNWRTREYALYLAIVDRLATELQNKHPNQEWTRDAVELALFGPRLGTSAQLTLS